MDNKKEVVYDLAGAFVAIMVGCIVVIMILVNLPNAKDLDGALIANVLTGGVTLFAPIAAYYLLSDWKEQFKFSKKVDFILEIRSEIRILDDELFKLRNYYPLDLMRPYDNEEIEIASKEYYKVIEKYENHIVKISDLFDDLHFLLNIEDIERNRIDKNLKKLLSFSILSKRAHRTIYNALIKNERDVKITPSFAKCRAAYDALYDGPQIETTEGKLSYDEGGLLINSIKYLKDACYELYEEGYSKNRSLLNRLLDK